MTTYTFPVCAQCRNRLRGGWPKFGSEAVKCGYCGTVMHTGLTTWSNLPAGKKLLLALRELLVPTSMGGDVMSGLIIGLLGWCSFIGAVPLILRFALMVKESSDYTRTDEPPTWKYLFKQAH